MSEVISSLQSREAEAQRRAELAEARAARAEEPDHHRLVEMLGDETARVLDAARDAAADIREKAEASAARLISEAHEQARELRAEGEADVLAQRTQMLADVEELRRDAEAELERRRAEGDELVAEMRREGQLAADGVRQEAEKERAAAAVEAEDIRDAARGEARRLVTEARTMRARVLGDLSRRRRVAREQVERLNAARDRLLAAYEVVRRTVDEATSELTIALPEAKVASDTAQRRVRAEPELTMDDMESHVSMARMAGLLPPLPEDTSPELEAVLDEGSEGAADGSSRDGDDGDRVPPGPAAEPGDAAGGDGDVEPEVDPLAGPEPGLTPDPDPDPDPGPGTSAEAEPDPGTSAEAEPSGGPGAVIRPEPEPALKPSAGPDTGPDPAAGGEAAVDGHGSPSPGDAAPAPGEPAVAGAVGRAEAADPADLADGVAAATGPPDDVGVPEGDPDRPDLAGPGSPDGPGTTGDPPGSVAAGPGPVRDLLPVEPLDPRAALDAGARPDLVDDAYDDGLDDLRPGAGGADRGAEPAWSDTLGDLLAGAEDPVGDLQDPGAEQSGDAGEDEPPMTERVFTTSVDDVFARLRNGGGQTPDHVLLRQRDETLEPLDRTLSRRLKRVLADEQNEVMDLVRRGASAVDDLLPAPGDHAARYGGAAADEVHTAAYWGAAAVEGEPGGAGDHLAAELGLAVTGPLRDRIARSASEAEGDTDDLTERLRALYREWKNQHLGEAVRHVTAAAYALGVYEAIPEGTLLRWVVDTSATPCPDARENAGAGPVPKGDAFPTGHRAPPSHPGCRCSIVPVAGTGAVLPRDPLPT